jgi:hypothetical protein
MAGYPWFPLQAGPRVLALSAYAYQRGVSLLLAWKRIPIHAWAMRIGLSLSAWKRLRSRRPGGPWHHRTTRGTCTQTSNNWFAGVNNLLGNITAIAPDKAGSHVYVLIGKQDITGTDRIYLVAYQPVGTNLIKSSEIVISPMGERAALPAITVLDDGTVVMTYETYGVFQHRTRTPPGKTTTC